MIKSLKDLFVTLTAPQIAEADEEARARYQTRLFYGSRNRNGGESNIGKNVLGTRTEQAGYEFCKPIKRTWGPLRNPTGTADLGDFIDVKGVSRPTDRLIVYTDAPEHWAYLLVDASQHPRYSLCGWLWGHEAKKRLWLSDPVGGRRAYFVPRDPLRPPEELYAVVRRREGLRAFRALIIYCVVMSAIAAIGGM